MTHLTITKDIIRLVSISDPGDSAVQETDHDKMVLSSARFFIMVPFSYFLTVSNGKNAGETDTDNSRNEKGNNQFFILIPLSWDWRI